MTFNAGTKLGTYQIVGPLGAGGMGEVYRARDSKLKRDVAIKVLPAEFSRDPERLARAQREAEVLASLNHPHIAQIYGQEESGESRCLVLEFVDGETLQERLARGPIPMEEALEFGRQIADALEAAHERGIVHRDLKPANIKITSAGQIKVLDFGLAKASDVEAASAAASNSPTMAGSTLSGAILGTAAYMSPEQAKGRAADARSDIWAFGVVLYEMLTGKPAFEGETIVEILGGVMKVDPDWTALPQTTSPLIRSLLRRCLQKDRKRRLRDIADARFQIEEVLNEPMGANAVVAPARSNRKRLMWAAAFVVVAIAASALTAFLHRSAPPELPEARLQINTPPGNPINFAISPDGRKVVFQATTEGKNQLWLRPLESETAMPLAGTEGASRPFWSPDNASIGFTAGGKLKRIHISGGVAQTLADAGGQGGGSSWTNDGLIVFQTSGFSPLYRVPAAGGKPVEVTQLLPSQTSHRYPSFLPDGRHFMFFSTGTPEVAGLYLGSLDSKETRRLLDADTTGVFAPPHYVLFARQETLFAQALDMKTLEPVGDPFPVVDRVARDPGSQGSLAVSPSAAGLMAYRTAGTVERQLIWFDRSGKQIGVLGEPDAALESTSTHHTLSPDGRSVAIVRTLNANTDLWLMEIARGLLRRFTLDPASDQNPVWSPDGRRIAFQSYGKGRYDLYQKPVSGGAAEVLLESSDNKNMRDWSPDGRFILYVLNNTDLWALPLDGDRKPFVVAQSSAIENDGRFSPDSRWVAYQSNESGRFEVYVQPFPEAGEKWQISTNGGTAPQWRADGRELFYMAPGDRLTAVSVTLNRTGPRVEAGKPMALFTTRPQSRYAATPDSQRFLLNTPLADTSTAPITVILNWQAQLKK